MKQLPIALFADFYRNREEPVDCDDEDMFHVIEVFITIAASLAVQNHDRLTLEQHSILAIEFGKNMRQSVALYTGVDWHNEGWDEILEEKS